MRSTALVSAALALLLAGCATFKELEPKPELVPLERGYIELRNGSDNFRLDHGKHYFIKFPRPGMENFALVLRVTAKAALHTYLTRQFDDGKEPMIRIADDATTNDSLIVYAVDPTAQTYFWVIDSVRHDVDLAMTYRYVPRWRFTFENKYADFKETLASNLVDRAIFTGAAGAPAIDAVDFTKELERVAGRTRAIDAMSKELQGVAGLFPPGIAAGRDTAYLNYKALSAAVDDELTFQRNYTAALQIFQKEKSTWGNTGAFLGSADAFAEFLNQKERTPSPILEKARKAFQSRLPDVVPYYEKQLQRKRDAKPFSPTPPLEPVEKLYRAVGRTVPADFEALWGFIKRFNAEADGLETANDKLKDITGLLDKTVASPAATFYAGMTTAARDIRTNLPKPLATSDEHYRSVEAAGILALELGKAGEMADDLQALFATSELIVADVASRAWASAESRTRGLYEGRDGRTYVGAARYRDKVVRWFESDIFAAVKKATQDRLDAFVRLNESAYADVPGLYADSAFMPAYQLTFSSAGQPELSKKRGQIEEYIGRMRNYQFPEAGIKAIYKDFTRDMNAQGVERARAIVEHGRMYKGADKQITAIVTECDPTVAKWIVRPKEYRRILALPVTDSKRGVNEYVFRVKLQIPSEAQFPVFDINIKLPKELAEGAGREQWYEQITINKTPLKNEGRFRITSPTADNNYESQITPVQMDKEGNNILEVRFKKNTFKVYEISAMAQVPIMKKN